MSSTWAFHVDDRIDHNAIYKAMHMLDFTMAGHEDVCEICYGLRRYGDYGAIQGYLRFRMEKDANMVSEMVPDFHVRVLDFYHHVKDYVFFLCQDCIFV